MKTDNHSVHGTHLQWFHRSAVCEDVRGQKWRMSLWKAVLTIHQSIKTVLEVDMKGELLNCMIFMPFTKCTYRIQEIHHISFGWSGDCLKLLCVFWWNVTHMAEIQNMHTARHCMLLPVHVIRNLLSSSSLLFWLNRVSKQHMNSTEKNADHKNTSTCTHLEQVSMRQMLHVCVLSWKRCPHLGSTCTYLKVWNWGAICWLDTMAQTKAWCQC